MSFDAEKAGHHDGSQDIIAWRTSAWQLRRYFPFHMPCVLINMYLTHGASAFASQGVYRAFAGRRETGKGALSPRRFA